MGTSAGLKRLVAASTLALAACGGGEPPAELPRRTSTGRVFQEIRPTDTSAGTLWHFAPGDVVESHASPGGSFRVHFTRAGTNAVPVADADGSGVPDFVEQLAGIYDEVLAFYEAEGFRRPLSDEGRAAVETAQARLRAQAAALLVLADALPGYRAAIEAEAVLDALGIPNALPR